MAVTCNSSARMPSWFDVFGLEEWSMDEPGLIAATARIERMIAALPVPVDKVILFGISQGGALALTTALRRNNNDNNDNNRLAGVATFSSWLPMRRSYPEELESGATTVPVFMGHGDADTMVLPSFGNTSAKVLRECGFQVEQHVYTGLGHWV